MTSIHRFLSISIVLLALLSAGLGFANEDHLSIKRVVGDLYDITISGERQADSVTVERVRLWQDSCIYHCPTGFPGQSIIAIVTSTGNDSGAKSKYSFTFRRELVGPFYGLNYYVTDKFSTKYDELELADHLLIDNYTQNVPLNDHYICYDDSYYFYPDLTNSSFEPQQGGVFTLRNVKVQGVETPVWATFMWNMGNLKFELKESGFEN